MANRFVHIGCMFPALPRTAEVDSVLSSVSDDWIRYAANNWILWSSHSANDIYNAVKSRLGPNDQMLIVGMDMQDRNGYLAKWIWDWMRSKQSETPRTLADILGEYTQQPQKSQPGLLGNSVFRYVPPGPKK